MRYVLREYLVWCIARNVRVGWLDHTKRKTAHGSRATHLLWERETERVTNNNDSDIPKNITDKPKTATTTPATAISSSQQTT